MGFCVRKSTNCSTVGLDMVIPRIGGRLPTPLLLTLTGPKPGMLEMMPVGMGPGACTFPRKAGGPPSGPPGGPPNGPPGGPPGGPPNGPPGGPPNGPPYWACAD